MNHAQRKRISEAAERAGAVVVEMLGGGERHAKVRIRSKDGLHEGMVIAASTPGDYRMVMNLAGDMRRALREGARPREGSR
jgi:hypothetical protein